LHGPISKAKLDMVVHVCNLSYLEDGGRRTTVQSWPGKRTRSHLKNKAKRIESVAQVLRALATNWESLSSNPTNTRERMRERERLEL
jgi:hypothetical protein